MASDTATFTVNLNDEISSPAEEASGALQALRTKIQQNTLALHEMQQAMHQLRSGAGISGESIKNLSAQIAAKKSELASAQESFLKLGGVFGGLRHSGEEGAGGTEILREALKEGKKSIAESLEESAGLGKGLSKLAATAVETAGPLGILIGAIIVLGGAAVTATVEIAKMALEAANAARNQLLLFQVAAKGSAEGGMAIKEAVDAVSGSVAISYEEVSKYATGLARAGLKGASLEKALRAVSIAAATGQDAAGLESQIEAAARAGQSIDALANKMNKFAGIAKAQMLSLNVQSMKFHENLDALFEGVKIEPFLEAIHDLLELFDQSTASGRALKAIAEAMLNPLFGALAKLKGPMLAFFKGMIIAGLQLAIVVTKLKNDFAKIFPDSPDFDWVTLFVAMGRALGFVLTAVAFLVSLFGALVGILIGGVTEGVKNVAAVFIGLWLLLKGLVSGFTSVGSDLIDGLVKGIENGTGMVIKAVKGLGSSAMGALKSVLGIGSPSKVFAGFGNMTAQGFAGGVDMGGEKVDAAVTNMVSIPSGPAPRGGASAGGMGKGMTIGTLNVSLPGVTDVKSFSEQLNAYLEAQATQAGVALA